ncbi:MAG: biopolymer transporter ExbD [Pyrinomonadaceae bacterium]
MTLFGFKTFLILFVTLVFIARFAVWSIEEHKIIYTLRVKVPPPFEENLSDEERFWKFQKFLFPQTKIPNPTPQGLPNDDSLFIVSLEKDGNIKLNSEPNGSVKNLEIIKQRLKEIFDKRAEVGVFEPKIEKAVKAVSIKAPLSAKYGDVAKIVDALKESGADPIVLQIDGLPQ